MRIEECRRICAAIKAEIGKVVIGQDAVVDLMLTSLLSGGHVLLEGPPGTAKTLLARAFARCMSLDYKRIQFTPDLMPGDILGTNLYNFQQNAFHFTEGPIFTELLLADEINRTPPKTQAALLEAMSERSVTIDGKKHELSDHFMVTATQNPIEFQGTYPLPEAQLDRFLFKVTIDYPTAQDEKKIVMLHGRKGMMPDLEACGMVALVDSATLKDMRETAQDITLVEDVASYIVRLIRGTRNHPQLQVGASTRAAIMLSSASAAYALLQGRDYAMPDDVKFLAAPCLRHRLILNPMAEIEGVTIDEVIESILSQIKAAR